MKVGDIVFTKFRNAEGEKLRQTRDICSEENQTEQFVKNSTICLIIATDYHGFEYGSIECNDAMVLAADGTIGWVWQRLLNSMEEK